MPAGSRVAEINRDNTKPLGPNLPPTSAYSHVYFSKIQWLAPEKIRAHVEMYDRISDGAAANVEGEFEFTFAAKPAKSG